MKNQLLKITLKGTCSGDAPGGFVDRGKPLGVSLWEKGIMGAFRTLSFSV